MEVNLTKQFVLGVFTGLLNRWKNPPFVYPAFLIEQDYMNFFCEYLQVIPVGEKANIVPIMRKQLEHSLERVIRWICRVMDQHTADGTAIWNLINERQLIVRRDWKAYNKQLPGKGPKGITAIQWEDYNHWLLALTYWNGFIKSQEDDFKITLPEDIGEADLAILLSRDFRPLFGMRAAFTETESPCISRRHEHYGECISLTTIWNKYLPYRVDWQFRNIQ